MPELKYCERCGLYLGCVHAATKYCRECRDVIRNERQTERRHGKKEIGKAITCDVCGKPLVKTGATQKYHPECKLIAKREQDRVNWARRKNEKARKEASKAVEYSVLDVQKMAEKAGCSYGEMSLRLAKGD